MDKYLTKDQVKVILQNAPKNTTPGGIVNALASQGYKIEGFNDQPAPVAPKKPGVFSNIVSDIKTRGANVANEIGNTSQNPIVSGFKAAEQGFGALTDTAGNAIRGVVGDKPVDTVEHGISSGFNAAANKLGDTSLIKGAAMSGQTGGLENTLNVASSAGNIAGTIDAAGGVAKTLDAGAKFVSKGATKAVDALTPSAESQVNDARASFQNNLDKALPPLKNDVRNLPARYTKAETAFKDIVQNKDSIGILDDAGNTRLPKDFTETVQAQQSRLKDIYKGYTAKLGEVDAPKFEADITSKIQSKVQDVANQLKKENSLDGRTALTKIQKELSTLRDTSPEGIQKYIEDIGQRTKTAPGAPMTVEQARLANLAGDMKNILDDSISKLDGPGYSELRAKYAAHKSLQDQLLRASAKEMRDTPGLMEKASNVGLTVEGLNYLLTQNPAAIVTGLGFKGATAFAKWLKSPTRALKNAFSDVERGYLSDVSPQTTIPTATNTNMNAISKTVAPKVPKSKGFIQSSVDNLKTAKGRQGGFIALPSTKVPEFMRPNEKLAMQNFIDHARLGKDISDSTFEIASKIAEKLGVSMDKTPKSIANVFEKYVSGQKKLTKPLFTK